MSALDRHDMQGMLLSAYGHLPWSANVILHVDDPGRARAWLQTLAAEVTPATGKHHQRSTNIAFTYHGLCALGLGGPDLFPLAFVDGMASARRAQILGDSGASAPAVWSWGSDPDSAHILLLLFAHEQAALQTALAAQRAAFADNGLREVCTISAERHPDGREHFGFSDGIAQPAIRGVRDAEPRRRRTNGDNDVAAGEFVLGYPNAYGRPPETPLLDAAADPAGLLPDAGGGKRDFGRNGSYLVLRQLEQDVAAFWRFLDDRTRGPQGSNPAERERLAAKIVGRWPSGAPLVGAPLRDDPKLAKFNDFGFAADRRGLTCPVGSHIRRANPRDGFAGEGPRQSVQRSNRHRLLRRGRPYGPRIANALEDDGVSRGLVFIALNSDIERQFEFVHQTWLNNATFCGLASEVDPLVGTQDGDGRYTIPGDPLRTRVKGIPRFVTTKGGAYFFMPGLRALRFLAAHVPVTAGDAGTRSAPPRAEHEDRMDDRWEVDAELGESLARDEEAIARNIAALIARGVCEQFAAGGPPARRDVHARAHGCVRAVFAVEPGLSAPFAQGVFVPGARYAAWIRFSNGAARPQRPDTKGDVHAMAIKLLDVPDTANAGAARTQDFILLDSPVFAACDAAGYRRFIARGASRNPFVRLCAPLALGLRGMLIGRRMQSARIGNPLAVRYWSTVPYRLGDPPHKLAVKYAVTPRAAPVRVPVRAGPRYLREAMIASLRDGDAAFDFFVQPRTSAALSVEDARGEWKEADAPLVKVATIIIERQEFATPERDALAEDLAFDPWHALPQHRPLGGVNRTRRVVYETIADLRRRFNGAALREPDAGP